MTPPLARADAGAARWPKTFAAMLFVLAAYGFANAATARPLELESDADIAIFVEKLRQFRDASRVRWVIAAPNREDALARLAQIVARLEPSERELAARVGAQALDNPAAARTVRAWMQPQLGGADPASACSWQVWLTDPAFPGPTDEPILTPLAPNDRVPVGPSATFRIGHAGLLQSRLYAFGETRAGAVRDLATAPDANIPVATESGGETIILATAREATPFLDQLKTALAESQGRRLELGPKYALREKLIGKSRGIGANIQAIPQGMIVDLATPVTAGEPAQANSRPNKMLETCAYVLTPAP